MSRFIKTRMDFAILLVAFCFSMPWAALGGEESYLKRGYIQNDRGDKCWYEQRTDTESKYFYAELIGTVGRITFTDPQCMSDRGLGLDTNIMMINNIISRWYSHADAKFATRVSEMYKSSMLQRKGRCIQSRTYPAIGITVDYIIGKKSITGVVHGSALQGCTN